MSLRHAVNVHAAAMTSQEVVTGHTGPARKKQRSFIARQACDACRAKRARCDEALPCGLCASQDIECHYGDRKITKHEASYSTIMRGIRRIEHRLEAFEPSNTPNSSTYSPTSGGVVGKTISTEQYQPIRLSFSAHSTLAWPCIQSLLPPSVLALCHDSGFNYVSAEELNRSLLPASSVTVVDDWISQTSLKTFQDLSMSYFQNFNTTYPVLDHQTFFQQTLVSVMNSDFGPDVDSSIVLLVMALGSCSQELTATRGDVRTPSSSLHTADIADMPQHENTPGLSYFIEARRRMALCDCNVGLKTCQMSLLAGLYHAQSLRPLQSWIMISKASLCLQHYWRRDQLAQQVESSSTGLESAQAEWEHDMQSRLFWICVTLETLFADELQYPAVSLQDLCDSVPLPRFCPPKWLRNASSMCDVMDTSYFHYHFLSQTAHRTLLTRIRDTLFISGESDSQTHSVLEEELYNQLEQWRNQLPRDLAFELQSSPSHLDLPYGTTASAWLRARYVISKYHIRRPLIYRVAASELPPSEQDVEKCGDALSAIIEWTSIMEHISVRQSCMPLRFFMCSQLFGQMVVVFAFSVSPHRRLLSLVTPTHVGWYKSALEILSRAAKRSDIIAKDFKIATHLYESVITATL
ncbi:hypothetical protein AC579_1425 [Pseudocercospora musae]|uniref:Zn(2)-C6 fungal-type domain-containing protein n=1 Tax=Pseudocercospora musae TaxID=113226 RepID=A0A139IMC0_9PEZI|nr:hypothetical protein AC579_1425 [Pseudocercospora musae]